MRKILITGANGQLGRELAKLLPEALLTDKDTLNIADAGAVQAFVREHQVDTIINCAAYTAVDQAEAEAELAARANQLGAENLARTGATIIHLSTDYVFDGSQRVPYTEESAPHPLSVYGKTKLAGEEAVLRHAETAIIIRTSWMFSPHGHNFLTTMRHMGAQQQSISVVEDQIGSPTYAGDLARAIVQILPQISPQHKGIYHYSNEGSCSWHEFAATIMKLSGLGCRVSPIPTSAYPSKAVRPPYSVLDKTKIKSTFTLTIPHWKKGLEACLKQF